MSRIAVIAAIALFAASSARAEVPNPIDCNTATTTVEMNYCMERDYKKADAALNDVYETVIAEIKATDNRAPYDAKSWEKELRRAQRAWIAFRDAECKGLIPMEWSGGTGTTVAVLSCMKELTEARTKALRRRYLDR